MTSPHIPEPDLALLASDPDAIAPSRTLEIHAHLGRCADCILLDRIPGEEIDRKSIVLPALHQTDTRRTLIANFQKVIALEFILGTTVKVQYIRVAKVRIPPLRASGAEICTDIRRCSSRPYRELHRVWPLAQAKDRAWIAGG